MTERGHDSSCIAERSQETAEYELIPDKPHLPQRYNGLRISAVDNKHECNELGNREQSKHSLYNVYKKVSVSLI